MRKAPFSKHLKPGVFGYSACHPITILSGMSIKERRDLYIWDIRNILGWFGNSSPLEIDWPVSGRWVQIIDDGGDRDALRELTRAVLKAGASRVYVLSERAGDSFSDWELLGDIRPGVSHG